MIKTAFGLAPYSSLRVVGLQRGAYTRIALLSLALGAGACGDDHDTDADVGMDASASNHDTDPTKTEPMKAGSGSNHVVDDAGPGSGPMTNDASMMMDKPHGSVEGVVYRADTLKPVSGAVITGPDGIQAKTDKHGKFKLTMLQTERTALLANAKNFAQAVEPVSVVADQSTAIEFRLLHVSAKADVDSSKGGQVRAASGAEVVIDKAAFVDANGKPVTGMVTVELTVLDPSSAAGMEAFPGDFTATSKKGNDGQLESFVPMEITVRQGDDVLDFASGKGADVSFPVPEALKDKAPQTIALWSLSETTGAWVEEGTATLITDGAGMLVYRGRLTHMSWWNCDRFIDSVTCIRGCVTLDGKPAASVETQAEGIDYSNLGMDRTGSDGCFAEDVKAGGQLRVRALSDDAATEWKVITASDTRMSVRDDRKKCMDVGTLELIERKPADVGCPAGSTKCGSTCVDLASDYDNCGSCDNSCFGSKANGTQCINSKCSCAASETRCPGDGPDVCTDVNFDEANCGKCGARCGSGQTCEAGTCKKLACEDGLTRCGSSCVDVDDNSLHCGECNAACDAGETCSAGACKKLSCGATFEKCGNECVAEGTCPKSDVGGDNGGNAGSNGGNAGSNGGNAGSSGGNAGSNGGGGSGTAGATGGGGGTNGGSAGSNGGGGSGTAGATGGGGSDGEGGNDGSGGFGGGAGASGGTDGGTGNPGDEPDGGFGGGGFGGFGGHGGTGGFGGGRDGGTGNPGDEPDGGFGGGGFGGFGGHGGGGGFGGGTDAGMGGSLDAGIGGGGDCLPGEFYCPSDLNCVPMAWRCNGDEDCSGGEDEVHCGVTVCPGEFECHVDESCISFTQFCDLLEDCPDGEDEQHCGGGGPMCPPQMFPCPDNTCVDSPEQCTTTSCPPDAVQCPDGDCAPSPEQCGGGISCAKGQMQCVGEAGPTCATMCDQLAECSNGMDENPFTCCEQSGGMMCNTGDHLDCVSADHVCADDGTQCADGQDEDPGMCCDQHDGMLCSDGDGQEICVSASQVCADDGAQCANGQDEDPQRCCSKDRGFFCAGSQDCIDNAKLCDQVPDCADGSDESLNNCGCPGGGFACNDGSMCIDASLRCDGGLPDCNDGSDEEHCGCPEGKVTCPNQTCADDFSACPPVK